MSTVLFLILMSLIAGVLTGIVGMASSTLYPVLLSVGIQPITANATITVAQVGAGLGTVISSLKELHGHWKQALQIAILNTIGGVFGALILIHSSNTGFKKMVPLFILLAGIMILYPQKANTTNLNNRFNQIMSWLSLFLVGVYNGYFGAASGLLMIAVLSKIVKENYAIYNAMRNLASFCNNVVAAGLFIFRLSIDWAMIIPLLLGLFIGGLIGPIIVRYIPSTYIKTAVGGFAIILAFILGYEAYL
ncbi:sulfite exporter TauE/SafE family protein [Pediococcus ethanolidurans]|uniref:sulfite exporter TauE/SafE family protein n=1 Tax=Pediococcus ethanolidurans TaxID=319653 RepID=UPI001C1EB79C|nr:sulfite exporter TauE/SafE family protein [Pediococcus ethanolidurans]MBU7563450.1 sulfite exporter TauE/SafE family protein [Pediococcus ethanolidurans]MCT4398333.1 sulfite exporter TauE/SafE family protein [Pediococcus ethanolidurans]MCV3321369.1 sulfite exporter TauE/SafE family protein [Pediococcus ethanolidurans]MCV3323001.1 sulfite exporter TauE/SafE family protein [Pediococcus ethanolidurans]